ncbi:MAG: sugar transferase EpsL [Cyclobacteriaceae bacterium]|jgi:sugar transferase EpsL
MKNRNHYYIYFIKPFLDRMIAFLLIILLFLIFLIVAIINLTLGLPIFFVHHRPGFEEKIFGLIKFCTIAPNSGAIGSFSNFLRKSSLDELPQLFNILKGDMSFVGPRPLLIAYLDQYTKDQHRRHSVKPGITGLAQVNGRNELSLEEKINFDLQFADQISFWLDVEILIKTICQIFRFSEADGHLPSKKVNS